MKNTVQSPKYVIELARAMRQNLTPSEKILWEELRKKKVEGYRFRTQHPVFRYIIDFYCHEKLIAVEVDGDIHKSRRDYDEYRDAYLESLGIRTLRFTNDHVINDLSSVVEEIRRNLLCPPFSQRGGDIKEPVRQVPLRGI